MASLSSSPVYSLLPSTSLVSGLCLAALVVGGCGPQTVIAPRDAAVDAATDAAPVPTNRTLEFLPSDDLAVEPGAVVTLRVRMRDDAGEVVVGEEVRFALVGEAEDATIDVTRSVTARATAMGGPSGGGTEEGVAVVRLTAPTRGPAMFRVRASASGAPETYRNVSVSSQGFGSLALSVRYAGTRGPAQINVSLFVGAACTMLDRIPDRVPVSVPPPGATITFGPLAAGVSLAVRGEALSAAGEVLARGCIDTLDVRRDETTAAALPLEDLPLRVQGAYVLEAALDLGALTVPAVRAWQTAVQAAAPEGDAVLLLSAVASAIELRAGPSARASFEATWGRLLPALRADLASNRYSGPSVVLSRLAEDTGVVLRGANLSLSLGADDDNSLVVRSGSLRLDPLTPDVERDDVMLALPAGGTGIATPLFGDRLRVRMAGVPLPFSAAARRASDAVLARRGVTSAAEWALLNMRCSDFAALVSPYSGTCDAACVRSTCEASVTAVATALTRATDSFGSEHARVDFEFEATARGRMGSLRIEDVEAAPLAGFYEGDTDALFVGAVVLGSP